ncbi:MAG TPA: c-type cytochrome [Allosphingosinicella sp.]|jgi:cytochrome c oxidase subunit 2
MRGRLALLPLLALAGCDGVQTMTGGDGRDAEQFNSLFTLFIVVTLLFYAAVLAFLAWSWFRRRGKAQDGLGGEEGVSRSGTLRTGLIVWIAAVVLGIATLTVGSYVTDSGMAHTVPARRPVLSVEIVGNQWWWDVQYHFADPSRNVRTANELHLPLGVPTQITLKSNDVIHSFWVPNIAGKQDLIPGANRDIVLVPTRVGQYRGQCAEYCGMQHAHMAFDVTVESKADFARWLTAQSKPAPVPTTPLAKAGYDYFMNRECSTCHNITGTPATGQVAPDLTHVASRKSIAAGTLPMTRGHLYAWVADPQGAKPGTNMPYIGLEAQELHQVVAYLETLK